MTDDPHHLPNDPSPDVLTMTRRLLRPSSAPIWSKCAGSYVLEALYPEDEESLKAREGTAAHFYVTEAVQGRVHPVGTLAPNGHPIDEEMIEAGQCFVDDVMREAPGLFHEGRPVPWSPESQYGTLRIETKLTMHGLIHGLCEGTPDGYLLDLAGRRLIIWDFKYGHGYVDPRTAQLIAYAAGVFEAHELTADDVADLDVSLRIVQPRNYDDVGPVRRWDTKGRVIMAEIEVLARMAEAATGPNPTTQTGEHCRYCAANHGCPAAQAVALNIVDMAGKAVPRDLPPAALGLHLRNLQIAQQRLKGHVDAVEATVMAETRKGSETGWTVTHGKARERWAKPPAEVFALGDMMGVDLRKPPEAITPNQARDLGLDAAVIAAYAERPSGAAKLTPRDASTAARVFGGKE